MVPAEGVFGKEKRRTFLTFGTGPDADGKQDDEIGDKDDPVEGSEETGVYHIK